MKKIFESMKTVILNKIKEHDYSNEIKMDAVQFIFESCRFNDYSNLTISIENKDRNGKVKETKYKVTAMDYGSAVCEADRQYKKPEVREVNVEAAVFNVKGSYIQHVYGKSKDGPYV